MYEITLDEELIGSELDKEATLDDETNDEAELDSKAEELVDTKIDFEDEKTAGVLFSKLDDDDIVFRKELCSKELERTTLEEMLVVEELASEDSTPDKVPDEEELGDDEPDDNEPLVETTLGMKLDSEDEFTANEELCAKEAGPNDELPLAEESVPGGITLDEGFDCNELELTLGDELASEYELALGVDIESVSVDEMKLE